MLAHICACMQSLDGTHATMSRLHLTERPPQVSSSSIQPFVLIVVYLCCTPLKKKRSSAGVACSPQLGSVHARQACPRTVRSDPRPAGRFPRGVSTRRAEQHERRGRRETGGLQARALEAYLIDFALQPLWTCARHVRQRLGRKSTGSPAHCCSAGNRDRRRVASAITDRSERSADRPASCGALFLRSYGYPGHSKRGCGVRTRTSGPAAGHAPRMPSMRREHSRELGLHSYFRYLDVCAHAPPGASSAAARRTPHTGRPRSEGCARARGARERVAAATAAAEPSATSSRGRAAAASPGASPGAPCVRQVRTAPSSFSGPGPPLARVPRAAMPHRFAPVPRRAGSRGGGARAEADSAPGTRCSCRPAGSAAPRRKPSGS